MTMTNHFTLSALALAALLGACAGTPTAPPSLLGARDALKVAESNPAVLTAAPLELKKASDSLRRAEDSNAKGLGLAETDSASYIATRQAQAAIALAAAKTNEETIKSAETERERARADQRAAEARKARAETAEAKQESKIAKAEAGDAQALAADAQARAVAAQATTVAAQQQAQASQQQTQAMQQQLQDLKARQTDRGILVTLGDVLFEFGRSDIKPAAQGSLQKLADYLAQQPGKSLLIEGYTDSVGSDVSNVALSQRRAESVAQALGRMGVNPGRISARGLGKSKPVADNTNDTNRALNRRVEVYIS